MADNILVLQGGGAGDFTIRKTGIFELEHINVILVSFGALAVSETNTDTGSFKMLLLPQLFNCWLIITKLVPQCPCNIKLHRQF